MFGPDSEGGIFFTSFPITPFLSIHVAAGGRFERPNTGVKVLCLNRLANPLYGTPFYTGAGAFLPATSAEDGLAYLKISLYL